MTPFSLILYFSSSQIDSKLETIFKKHYNFPKTLFSKLKLSNVVSVEKWRMYRAGGDRTAISIHCMYHRIPSTQYYWLKEWRVKVLHVGQREKIQNKLVEAAKRLKAHPSASKIELIEHGTRMKAFMAKRPCDSRVVKPMSGPVVEVVKGKCLVVVLLLVRLLLLFCSALLENLPDFSVWRFVLSFVPQCPTVVDERKEWTRQYVWKEMKKIYVMALLIFTSQEILPQRYFASFFGFSWLILAKGSNSLCHIFPTYLFFWIQPFGCRLLSVYSFPDHCSSSNGHVSPCSLHFDILNSTRMCFLSCVAQFSGASNFPTVGRFTDFFRHICLNTTCSKNK